jgi:hypothetical protein
MIKTACCRQINLAVIKTHDLINDQPSMLRLTQQPLQPFDCFRSGTGRRCFARWALRLLRAQGPRPSNPGPPT